MRWRREGDPKPKAYRLGNVLRKPISATKNKRNKKKTKCYTTKREKNQKIIANFGGLNFKKRWQTRTDQRARIERHLKS